MLSKAQSGYDRFVSIDCSLSFELEAKNQSLEKLECQRLVIPIDKKDPKPRKQNAPMDLSVKLFKTKALKIKKDSDETGRNPRGHVENEISVLKDEIATLHKHRLRLEEHYYATHPVDRCFKMFCETLRIKDTILIPFPPP